MQTRQLHATEECVPKKEEACVHFLSETAHEDGI